MPALREAKVELGKTTTVQADLLAAGEDRSIADLNLKLAYIPPGNFQMGSEKGDPEERPVTRVSLSQGFWLGVTEITQGQWTALMGANPSLTKGEKLPVEDVTWSMAMDFCRKLTERERAAGRLPDGYVYTLPTEAQWEYACRAGTTDANMGSLEALGWLEKNSGGHTHEVAQKPANAWGLHDMYGNVMEWCLDWYGSSLPGGSVNDPRGPSLGTLRVIRGGGYGNPVENSRPSFRGRVPPDFTHASISFIGFRIALVTQWR